MKNKLNLVLVILVLCVLGCVCPPPKEKNNAYNYGTPTPRAAETVKTAPQTSTPAASTPQRRVYEAISWNEYDRIYNVKSTTTDMQKDSQWANFKDKYVQWSGEVVEVSEGTFGGLVVTIKMNPETFTHDIRLECKDDQKAKMAGLSKGERITFSGRLKSYGGAVVSLIMDDGEIK